MRLQSYNIYHNRENISQMQALRFQSLYTRMEEKVTWKTGKLVDKANV